MTTDTTSLFLIGLFLLFACAVLVGELFTRIGQPALVGQILVGVVLGPALLGPYLGLGSVSTELSGLQIVATFFIIMMAGLAVSPAQIRSTGASAAIFGITIFFIPFLLGAFFARLLYPSLDTLTDLFIALAISITALPVMGVMLRDFEIAGSRFGTYLLSVAVINELCAVTVFAVLLRIYTTGAANTGLAIAEAVGVVGLFLLTVLAVHYAMRMLRHLKVWDRMVGRFRSTWRTRDAWFAIILVVALAAALYSQLLGLTFIIGAFYAGLLITPESAGRREHRELTVIFDAITWGFFIPLFFALVGYSTDFRLLGTSAATIVPFIALALVAIFSKIFAGAGIARLQGWTSQESMAAGFLVTSRGAVELAMAVIMLNLGVINQYVYTVIAGVGVICTIIAPIGARPFIRALSAERRQNEIEARRAAFDLTIPAEKPGPPLS